MELIKLMKLSAVFATLVVGALALAIGVIDFWLADLVVRTMNMRVLVYLFLICFGLIMMLGGIDHYVRRSKTDG